MSNVFLSLRGKSRKPAPPKSEGKKPAPAKAAPERQDPARTVPNDDFEIARKLLRGAWTPQRRAAKPTVVPASFREIDGLELARQYATHRKIEDSAELGVPSGRLGRDGQPRLAGKVMDWAKGMRVRPGEE